MGTLSNTFTVQATTPHNGNALAVVFVATDTVASAPTGWTQIDSSAYGIWYSYFYTRTATNSEALPYVWTLNSTVPSYGYYFEVQNTLLDTWGKQATTNSTSMIAPSIVTGFNNDWIFYLFFGDDAQRVTWVLNSQIQYNAFSYADNDALLVEASTKVVGKGTEPGLTVSCPLALNSVGWQLAFAGSNAGAINAQIVC